jgi:hypothetical protein
MEILIKQSMYELADAEYSGDTKDLPPWTSSRFESWGKHLAYPRGT